MFISQLAGREQWNRFILSRTFGVGARALRKICGSTNGDQYNIICTDFDAPKYVNLDEGFLLDFSRGAFSNNTHLSIL